MQQNSSHVCASSAVNTGRGHGVLASQAAADESLESVPRTICRRLACMEPFLKSTFLPTIWHWQCGLNSPQQGSRGQGLSSLTRLGALPGTQPWTLPAPPIAASDTWQDPARVHTFVRYSETVAEWPQQESSRGASGTSKRLTWSSTPRNTSSSLIGPSKAVLATIIPTAAGPWHLSRAPTSCVFCPPTSPDSAASAPAPASAAPPAATPRRAEWRVGGRSAGKGTADAARR